MLAEYFAETAEKHNFIIESYVEKIDLKRFGINYAKCIDNKLIEKITNSEIAVGKDEHRKHTDV